jgi:hypothetical protein
MCSAENVGAVRSWQQVEVTRPPVSAFVVAHLARRGGHRATPLRILIHRFSRCRRPVFHGFSNVVLPLLPGSAQNVECDVTSTKQTTEDFLPGATTHSRTFRVSSKFATQSCAPAPHVSLLTGTGSQSKLALTHTKQTPAQFLTETGIAHRICTVLPAISSRARRTLRLFRGVLLD